MLSTCTACIVKNVLLAVTFPHMCLVLFFNKIQIAAKTVLHCAVCTLLLLQCKKYNQNVSMCSIGKHYHYCCLFAHAGNESFTMSPSQPDAG